MGPEDGGSMIHRNIGTRLQFHMASQPRRLQSTSTRLEIGPFLILASISVAESRDDTQIPLLTRISGIRGF
jgi:hypothetical protein